MKKISIILLACILLIGSAVAFTVIAGTAEEEEEKENSEAAVVQEPVDIDTSIAPTVTLDSLYTVKDEIVTILDKEKVEALLSVSKETGKHALTEESFEALMASTFRLMKEYTKFETADKTVLDSTVTKEKYVFDALVKMQLEALASDAYVFSTHEAYPPSVSVNSHLPGTIYVFADQFDSREEALYAFQNSLKERDGIVYTPLEVSYVYVPQAAHPLYCNAEEIVCLYDQYTSGECGCRWCDCYKYYYWKAKENSQRADVYDAVSDIPQED